MSIGVGFAAGADDPATSLNESKRDQAEQEPDRKHVPALGDEPVQRTEQAREESAVVEQEVEIVLDEGACPASPPERCGR
jgi:hypothetical protein